MPQSRRKKRPQWLRGILRFLAVIFAFALLVGIVGTAATALWAFAILPRSLPAVTALENFQPLQGSKLYDETDEPITELRAERRIFMPLAQIPKHLQQAIVAVEDARFYSHFGIDPMAIARAIYQNFRRGKIVEGGSTITQQLAKVLFLTPDKSLERKLKEAFLALELERRYSKDKLLELYLNQIYFGHGSFGVEAAAHTYFGKSVKELALPEAALLGALPRAPGSYSPFEHPVLARRRRTHVLNRMVEVGFVSQSEASQANGAGLGLVPPERRRTTGQYFVEYVQQLLEEQYGADMVFKGGLQVYTTLNPSMQLLAEQSLKQGLDALEARTGTSSSKGRGKKTTSDRPEGAVLTIEPQTGYIKAMVGGYDFFRSEFNRAVQAKRQPGSAFKPFVYMAALESGLTPATMIEDAPVTYPSGRNSRPWKPDNYDRKFRGLTTLQQGIEESINVVTVKLQDRVGINRTVEVARRLGIKSPLNDDLTIALGSSDLSLLELTSAYGALANQGVWVAPSVIRYITDAQGRLLEENIPAGREAFSPELTYVVTHMLRGVVERGTGIGAKALGRPIAAKTGTTNDFSNAWFIGYTPKLITGVWVGYDRPKSLGTDETGSRVAVPIWTGYMGKVLANVPPEDFPIPERVTFAAVDLDPAGQCTRPVVMAFVRGTEPRNACGTVLN
jgi:penicillin-binding protein 1A